MFISSCWAVVNGFASIWEIAKIVDINQNIGKYGYDSPNRIKQYSNNHINSYIFSPTRLCLKASLLSFAKEKTDCRKYSRISQVPRPGSWSLGFLGGLMARVPWPRPGFSLSLTCL